MRRPSKKLTPAEIEALKEKYLQTGCGGLELSIEFGVSDATAIRYMGIALEENRKVGLLKKIEEKLGGTITHIHLKK